METLTFDVSWSPSLWSPANLLQVHPNVVQVFDEAVEQYGFVMLSQKTINYIP